jgi:PAS domain S-box-containing protein
LFNQILAGQAKSNVSASFLAKDGRVVNVEGNVVPRIEGGKVTATHGFFRDVTERTQIEQARRESERMYATLVDNLPGFVYRCANDRNWTMLFVSDGCLPVTGYRPEDFINNQRLAFGDIIQADYREDIFHQWQDVLSRREAFEKEYPITTASGETRWVWERGQGVFSDSGEVLFLEGFITDITERRSAEAKEKQLRDKAEMSSRLAAVGEMAAGIAHEINNPLTGVIGFSEMLMTREGLPNDIQEDLKIINDGSQRVKEIIRRMLIFAQQSKPSSHLSDIHELIENTLELRSYVLRTANIEVVREYAADLPPIMVDPGQMQQVFLNLIVNAEYAMKKAHDRGLLTIRTEQVGQQIRITFEDDGGGIPAEAKTKLFQPFYTTKEPGEGTGLGLSLSRGIILEHGGTIDESGEAGVGARFVITLPMVTLSEITQAERPSGETARTTAALRDLQVLVVDDESSVRSYVKAMLTSSGNRVDEAGAYQDAMQLLAERDYEVVLLDIRMPGKSGIELYSEITALYPHLSRRIIFITGDISDQGVKEYLEQRDLRWVTKPFDRATLEQRIGEMLQDTESGEGSSP